MKKLIIAEKPSLAMEIVKAIGKMDKNDGYFENQNYIVSFAFGHLLSLQDIDQYYKREKTKWTLDELPFIPGEFVFQLKDDSGVKKQYKILKMLIEREDVTHIVNCGDADREGEVIINNIIYRVFDFEKIKKPVERLWLKSINQEEIQNSLKKLRPIEETKNLYNEGLARTYLDWLYGINLTRYVTLKANGLLPVGRVLTPIVKKVYDRKKEIENFIPEKYVEIEALIKKDEEEIKVIVKNSKFKEPMCSEHREKPKEYLDKEQIKGLVNTLNSSDSIVIDKQIKSVEKKPKKLFSLTTLQNHMVKNHKMTLEDTLKNVQSLYEKGYVTYPRTNTEYLHTSEIEDIKKLVQAYSDSYDIEFKNTKAIFDDSKVESHSALLPTLKKIDICNLNDKEQIVYMSIFNRFLCNFCKEQTIVEETKVQISTLMYKDTKDFIIEIKGNSIKQLGFYKYEKPDSKEKLLPYFELNEILKIKYFDVAKETNPPKLLTLVEMNNYLKNPFKDERKKDEIEEINDDSNEEIDKNEEDKDYEQMLKGIEIGTVATRDSIIANAIKYGYMTENKTVLDVTDKGIYLVEALEKLSIDMSKEKTVETSIILKEIYKNETTIAESIKKTAKYFEEIMGKDVTLDRIKKDSSDKEVIGKCPKCGKNIYENSKSYYCEGYKDDPKCNFSIWKNNKFFEDKGKKLTKTMAKKLIALEQIEVKKLKNKEGKEYDAFIKIKQPICQYINFEMSFKK